MKRYSMYGLLVYSILGMLHLIASQEPCLLVVNNTELSEFNIKKYLDRRNVPYVIIDKHSNIKEVMHNKFKGIILTGGPLMYSEGNFSIELVHINFAALLNIDCPVLGICFGHQTITELFGGKIGRLEQLAIGSQKVKILKKVEIFEGLPDEVVFKQYHYDCSMQIPYNFDLIATSDICYSEGIKHKTKPIFGVQFHPETSGPIGDIVLDNFLRLCGCKFTVTDPSTLRQAQDRASEHPE